MKKMFYQLGFLIITLMLLTVSCSDEDEQTECDKQVDRFCNLCGEDSEACELNRAVNNALKCEGEWKTSREELSELSDDHVKEACIIETDETDETDETECDKQVDRFCTLCGEDSGTCELLRAVNDKLECEGESKTDAEESSELSDDDIKEACIIEFYDEETK